MKSEKHVHSWLELHTKIGAAMVVDRDGEITQAHSGLRAIDSNAPIQANDRFHIGSITKSFTSSLVGQYIDAGRLSLDNTIAELAPNWMKHIKPE